MSRIGAVRVAARAAVAAAAAAAAVVLVAACAMPRTRVPAVAVVTLETTAGDIDIAVETGRAPITSADFLRYVDCGLYEGGTFFRVVRPNNDRTSPHVDVVQAIVQDEVRRLPPIAHETTRDTGLAHVDGTVSVARAAPGTGTAATFFITLGDQPALDYGGLRNADGQGFAAFGRVIRGMDVVRRVHSMPTTATADSPVMAGQVLSDPVVIRRAVRKTAPLRTN